jgi:hypothetical protein
MDFVGVPFFVNLVPKAQKTVKLIPKNTLLANRSSYSIPLFIKLTIQTEKGVNYHQTDVSSSFSLVSVKDNKIARQSFHV